MGRKRFQPLVIALTQRNEARIRLVARQHQGLFYLHYRCFGDIFKGLNPAINVFFQCGIEGLAENKTPRIDVNAIARVPIAYDHLIEPGL